MKKKKKKKEAAENAETEQTQYANRYIIYVLFNLLPSQSPLPLLLPDSMAKVQVISFYLSIFITILL